MLAIRSSIEPDVHTFIDHKQRHITVEVTLPGARKDTILLKVNDSSVFVQASARHTSYAKYILLHHPVMHHLANAVFKKDRLCVILPLKG